VERAAQLDFLAAQGCDFAQGYLIARPMSEDAYRAYLTNRQVNGDASSLAVIHRMRAGKGRSLKGQP
jgi:predicted signal transduction protein with EAL and GGDEF domain